MDLLFIVITACAGKFIGASLTAKLCGMGWRHTIAIGVMMNTRGLTEVVVLNIARDAGIIDDQASASPPLPLLLPCLPPCLPAHSSHPPDEPARLTPPDPA